MSARLGEMLGLRDVNGAAVTEARLALELGLVPLVVERAGPDDVSELLRLAREQVEDLRAGGYEPSTSARFHRRVAACAHNGAIDVLMTVLGGPLVMSLRQASEAVPHPGRRGAAEHLLFAEAVARRDTEAALEVMRRHIVRTGQRLGRSADLV